VHLTARSVTLRLAETFVISRGAEDTAEVVEVEIRHGDVSGFGEAAPIDRYDESAASALAWLEHVELGDDPFALDEIMERLPPGEHAARAAVDAALYDLQGKLTAQPVYKLLGVRRAWAADIVDGVARRSRRHGAARRARSRARVPTVEAEARRT
jgi:L-alanine-DL-glutamate epimerase-like enolase superfamily enzyme